MSYRARALAIPALAVPLAFGLAALPSAAQQTSPPPLLPEPVVRAIAAEVSGSEARRTVQDLALFHRMRGSRGFAAAAERVRDRAAAYGLAHVEILSLPADGTRFYGTQRSRPAWDADFAELWEMQPPAAGTAIGPATGAATAAAPPPGDTSGSWTAARRVASWETNPITLAQDSASGEVEADLVDVGEGAAEGDYAGKDVRGKLVLVDAQPGAAYPLAVDRLGAAGIVSCAQNQPTAWSREDENQVRWGHLETFPPPKTFAFMVSLKQARAWRERLAAGERVRLKATVRAGQHAGSYQIATAVLPGRDPEFRGEEIVLSCHLDHQQPGANDNASGCAAILETGRTLARLVAQGRIPAPRRTVRWVWPPEIEGTIALLNARPEMAARTRAVVHMDMVGGDAEVTKAVFHVTRSPRSLPAFVNDVAAAFGRFVNEQSYALAATGKAPYPLADPLGDKRALQAELTDFTAGSDHQVWAEGSFGVPAIYLNDWPDRTIHTHADGLANIDATKLLRAAFLGAASAYYLADLDASGVPALWEVVRAHALERAGAALARAAELRAAGASMTGSLAAAGNSGGGTARPEAAAGEVRRDIAAAGSEREAANLLRFQLAYERGVVDSIGRFAAVPAETRREAEAFLGGLERLMGGGRDAAPAPAAGPASRRGVADSTDVAPGAADGDLVYRRRPEPRGPMTGFGYSYLEDHLGQMGIAEPALLEYSGLWGGGSEYAYEALNLVDGRRTVRQVRDDLAAIYGPVPVEMVAEYLQVLEKIGVLARGAAP